MADITDPEVIQFSNKRARVLANLLKRLDKLSSDYLGEWNANNLSAKIPNLDSAIIKDGAEVDGRHIMTGRKATDMYNRANEVQTMLGVGGVRDTINQVATFDYEDQ